MKTKNLTTLILTLGGFLCCTHFAVNAQPLPGLVASYPFDSGAASDVSGNGYHGTPVNGASPTTDRFGKINSAFSFDGVNDFIQLPSNVLNNLTQGTFIATIYMETYNTNGSPIISKADPTLTDFMVAVGSQGRVQSPWVSVSEPQYLTGNHVVPLRKWVQVALTWDGTYWKQYVGGQLDYQFESSDHPRQSTRPVEIGYHEHCCLPVFFHGRIDDVQIYNRALTQPEIQQLNLWNSLLASYPFSGGSADDASGNGFHGTAMNGVTPTTDRFGNANSAMSFDGTNDFIELPTAVMNNLTQGSFVATIQLATYSTNWSPIISQADPSLTDFMLSVDGNGKVHSPWISTAEPQHLEGSHIVPVMAWTHVVFTWDGSHWRQYVNGDLDYQFAALGTLRPSSRPVEIGYHEHCCIPVYFEGKIDEVQIYNRVLEPAEVKQLYSLDSGLPFTGISKAVRLDHLYLKPGLTYQVQKSNDLGSWVNFGMPFSPTNGVYSHYVDAETTAAYFRVILLP